jgi:thioredoxin-like negative regulator of GroEL
MNVRVAVLACLTVLAATGLAAQHAQSLAALEARARADSSDPLAHFALAQGFLQKKQVDSSLSRLSVPRAPEAAQLP